MAIQLSAATLRVAKYLESDLCYHQTQHLVMIWGRSGLPVSDLAQELRSLMEDVEADSRDNGVSKINLDEVEWVELAGRYREIFILERDD